MSSTLRKQIQNEVIYTATGDVLNGAELDTGVFDTSNFASITVRVKGFQGANQRITSSTDSAQSEGVLQSDTTIDPTLSLNFFTIPCRARYLRIQAQNNTGATITDGYLEVTGNRAGPAPASTFPLAVKPTSFSPAVLSQSVLIGKNGDGVYDNVGVNDVGALNVSDFILDVIRGRFPTYFYDTKFGRNPSVSSGTTPEDVWNGGGVYTGFNATGNENIETFSSNAADAGTLVSSGTATGGSSTTIVDSGATFVTDGVAVGDCVIDDTKASHGIVSEVTSETTLTVHDWHNDGDPESGDSYRVATTASTGAAVVRWSKILDEDYVQQLDVYVIMNGTTGVTSTVDCMRCARGGVILVGSNDYNVGDITLRQATTIANIFAVMPAQTGQTLICADTVPANKNRIIQHLYCDMTRANGGAGSANVRFEKRELGEAWRALRSAEVSDSHTYDPEGVKGIFLPPKTDIKWKVQSVSDNNTIIAGEWKYIDIDI